MLRKDQLNLKGFSWYARCEVAHSNIMHTRAALNNVRPYNQCKSKLLALNASYKELTFDYLFMI